MSHRDARGAPDRSTALEDLAIDGDRATVVVTDRDGRTPMVLERRDGSWVIVEINGSRGR